MRITLFLCIVLIPFLFGCNYNYYQGTQMESQGRYEEAYELYHQALVESPDNNKYKLKQNAMALKTAEDMADRYFTALERNDYYNAYSLLNRSLSLDPTNLKLITEKPYWYKVLLIGRLHFNNEDLLKKSRKFENLWLTTDFLSAKSEQILRSKVDIDTGMFYLVDIIYKPVFSYIGFYSIQSIGIRSKVFVGNQDLIGPNDSQQQGNPQNKKGLRLNQSGFNTDYYEPLIELKNSQVQESRGDFDWPLLNLQGSVLSYALTRAKERPQDFPLEYWTPSPGIKFRTDFSPQGITVLTPEKTAPFLPLTLYASKENRLFVLDFGDLELKYFNTTANWGLRRLDDSSSDIARFDMLTKNLDFQLFSLYENAAIPYFKAAGQGSK